MLRLIVFCNFMISLCMASGVNPAWLDANTKESLYPSGKYYTGVGMQSFSEKREQDLANASQNAFGELSKSIVSQVKAETMTRLSMEDFGDSYSERQSLDAQTSVMSSSILADVGREIYIDEVNQCVYVLAYVSRNKLKTHYSNMIELSLSDGKKLLEKTHSQLQSGNKQDARKSYEELVRQLSDIHELVKLHITITGEKLPYPALSLLETEIASVSDLLSRGILIWINSKFDKSDALSKRFIDKLSGCLSKNDISLATNESEADYSIALSVTTRAGNTFEDIVNYYAESQLAIMNATTNSIIYSDLISSKGSGLSADQAIIRSIDNCSKKTGETIINMIK